MCLLFLIYCCLFIKKNVNKNDSSLDKLLSVKSNILAGHKGRFFFFFFNDSLITTEGYFAISSWSDTIF